MIFATTLIIVVDFRLNSKQSELHKLVYGTIFGLGTNSLGGGCYSVDCSTEKLPIEKLRHCLTAAFLIFKHHERDKNVDSYDVCPSSVYLETPEFDVLLLNRKYGDLFSTGICISIFNNCTYEVQIHK